MQRAVLILVTLSFLIYPAPSVSQDSSTSGWIEPGESLLPIGQAQTFQLLGGDGNEQTAAGWAVSGPDIAELRIEDGRAIVTGKAGSFEIRRNLTVRNDRLICSPGTNTSTPLPVRHSKMMGNVESVNNVAYSEFNLVADAGKCTPDSVLDPAAVHVKVTQRLIMLEISENMSSTSKVVETNTTEGNVAATWIQATVPTGDIIVGEQGTGNFLAVRRTRQQWRGTSPGTIEEFQYRLTEERTVKYRVPVPLSPIGFPSSMLLGENNSGYTTRGNTVIAFDTETGREKWRWESKKSNVLACIALAGDAVLVREGDEYTTLKDGKVENHRAEAYMLFVAKFRPDEESY